MKGIEMSLITKYFSKIDLVKIREACTKAEKTTSGEIRVSILQKRTKKQKELPIRDIALQEFYSIGMDKTRDKTGILIFILLKEKQFQIIADEGINNQVDPDTWQKEADSLVNILRTKSIQKA